MMLGGAGEVRAVRDKLDGGIYREGGARGQNNSLR